MDGIIIINKPKEYTSHDIVSVVKKITKMKVGHTGTLDPNATGVLPLLLGDATKISKYLINHDKTYEVTLQLGTRTTTADGEGEILEEVEVPEMMLEKDFVKSILDRLIGKQEQIPPMYSAIKVKGKKLYEYARSGQTVELESRKIEIYQIELIQIQKEEKRIIYRVSCSKGTYIRSLCEDISRKLGTIGYMKELNRTIVGDFFISQSISIEEMKKHKEDQEWIEKQIISIEQLFKGKGIISITQEQYIPFMNGVLMSVKHPDDVYLIYKDDQFLGLGIVERGKLKRDVIFKK